MSTAQKEYGLPIPAEVQLYLVLTRALAALLRAQEHNAWGFLAEAQRFVRAGLYLCEGLEEKRYWDAYICGLEEHAWRAFLKEDAGD